MDMAMVVEENYIVVEETRVMELTECMAKLRLVEMMTIIMVLEDRTGGLRKDHQHQQQHLQCLHPGDHQTGNW